MELRSEDRRPNHLVTGEVLVVTRRHITWLGTMKISHSYLKFLRISAAIDEFCWNGLNENLRQGVAGQLET
jgi:hypothetical protein